MDKNNSELSPRYYPAEITIWILGAILILYKLLGLKLEQPLSFINIKLQNQTYFPHIVSVTLFVVLMYFFLEFKQSPEKAKDNLLAYGRLAITTLWAVIALWFIVPKLVENTVYQGVSRVWYLGFLGIGFLLGFFAQILSFSTLMIRDPNEAKTLNLPRIPNATRAMYKATWPVLFLLMFCYFTLHFFAPDSIVHIASLLTALAFLYMVLQEMVFLCMWRDNNGNRVPYKERIAHFKEAHSVHDRSYELIAYGERIAADIGVSSSNSTKEIQDEIREKFVQKTEPNHLEILSKVLNQTGLDTLKKEAGLLLQDATTSGDVDVIRELIKKGCNVNARAHGSWTALLHASAQGYPNIMKILLDAGANPDISNVLGITPLMYGARYGNIDVCKMLIEYGTDLNLRDKYGDTGLMIATRLGIIEIVDILIQKEADISVKNLDNKNALDLAYELGHGKIAKKLRMADNKRGNH